jgi:transposase
MRMPTTQTKPEAVKILTIEDRLVLGARAKSDPGAIDELVVALALESKRADNAELRAETLERRVNILEHKLAVMLGRLFGRSSEKLAPGQLELMFSELAQSATPTVEPAEPPTEQITYTRKKPQGHGRDTFPPNVPRQDIKLEPDACELHCKTCDKDFRRIRDEISERGHYIPGYWEVHRYIRGLWACPNGCGSVATANLPPTLVPKSRFEPSVAVHTAVAKFADHQPLQRQCEAHARLGVEVAPTSLGDNVERLADLHAPTVAQMEAEVVAESHLHVDDTPVVALVDTDKVRNEKVAAVARAENKKKIRLTARVWVYVALSGKIFFKFTDDRSRDGPDGPAEVLAKFIGKLICDEFSGFDKICRRRGLKRAACWAHLRRKIKDALDSDRRRCSHLLLMIQRLFRIEAAAKLRREDDPSFGDAELLALRQRRSRKLVEKIIAYAKAIQPDVLPGSGLGGALTYLLGNQADFQTFLDDPLVPLDNNAAERGLRAIALGRKNYLHFGSLEGGDTAAILYSLIGSCKALGLNPYAYLSETTMALLAKPDTPRAELTPWAWAAARAKQAVAAAAADIVPADGT